MANSPDSFPSPNNGNHHYDVPPVGQGLNDSDLEGVTDVTIISSDGARKISAEDVQADRLRRKPRLGHLSIAQTFESASFRWALDEADEDGVMPGSHFEGGF